MSYLDLGTEFGKGSRVKRNATGKDLRAPSLQLTLMPAFGYIAYPLCLYAAGNTCQEMMRAEHGGQHNSHGLT